jgi:Domain of unknown function (DUF4124)
MRKITVIAITTLLGSAAFAAGEVYRWRDAQGVVHFSDQQQPGAELVRGARPAPATPAETTPATVTLAATINPPAAPASSDTPLPVSKEVAAQVRQEAAAAKSEVCEKAKADYSKKVQAQRIFRTDAKGNRVYMTDAEIDAARLEARAARDQACGT